MRTKGGVKTRKRHKRVSEAGERLLRRPHNVLIRRRKRRSIARMAYAFGGRKIQQARLPRALDRPHQRRSRAARHQLQPLHLSAEEPEGRARSPGAVGPWLSARPRRSTNLVNAVKTEKT